MKSARRLFWLCGIGLLWASGAAAQDVTVQRVTKHAITLSMSNLGMHTNVTVVETQQGLVAIETEITPYIMGKIKEAAEKKLGRDDWAYVINTHAHLHHAGGNCLFPQAQIVGHETMSVDWLRDQLSTGRGRRRFCHTVGVDVAIRNLSTTLKRPGLTLDQKRELRRRLRFCRAVQQEILTGFRVANPTITFADRHTLDLGDVHLRLIYWGDGIHHSSIFVHVVEDRLLVGMGMAGSWIPDFYGTVTLDGIRRAISLWKEFCAKDAEVDVLIGVHAPKPIFSRRQFSRRHQYLEAVLDDLTEAQQQGLSLEEAGSRFSLSKRYPDAREYFTLPEDVNGVHRKNIETIWSLLQEETLSNLQK